MILKFDVRGEKLTCDENIVVVEGNKGTYEAEFTFDSEWDNYAKVCVFENEGECLPVPVINDKAILPLAERISAKIGVIGVEVYEDGSISTRISTNMLSVSVKNGAASSSAVSKLSKEAEMWEVYIARLDEKLESAFKNIDEKREEYQNEVKNAIESINEKIKEANDTADALEDFIDEQRKEAGRIVENMGEEIEEATKTVSNLVSRAEESAGEAKNYAGEAMEYAQAAYDHKEAAYGYKDQAQAHSNTAEQALADLLAMINSGDIILATNGKLPLSAIPATATQEIYVVESEDELTSLVAQRGDLAELVESINGERTITKTWQCLGNPSVRNNWVVWGTSYAVSAGNSEQSKSAENSARINGHRLVEMSAEEFENAVKDDDTYYLVY